jgi:hypothetical protein
MVIGLIYPNPTWQIEMYSSVYSLSSHASIQFVKETTECLKLKSTKSFAILFYITNIGPQIVKKILNVKAAICSYLSLYATIVILHISNFCIEAFSPHGVRFFIISTNQHNDLCAFWSIAIHCTSMKNLVRIRHVRSFSISIMNAVYSIACTLIHLIPLYSLLSSYKVSGHG